MRKTLILAAACLALAAPSFAAGVLSFTPSATVLNGAPGDTIDFSATLKNTGDADLFLNDLSFSFGAADSFLTGTFLFSNVLGTFTPSDPAWTGVLAQISVDPSATPGSYSGFIHLLGGASMNNFNPQTDVIASSELIFNVVPEPGTLGLGLCATAAILAIQRRRRS